MASAPPKTVLGKFAVGLELGAGHFATAYRGREAGSGRDVAIKILHPALVTLAPYADHFNTGLQAAAHLSHPHVVPILGHGNTADGLYVVVSPLMAGGSLASYLSSGPLPWDEALRILGEIGTGLDYVHSQGVLHGDLRPANVLFDDEGSALLADVNLIPGEIAASVDPYAVGRMRYVAPEVWNGMPAGPEADIYSLGLVFCEMLTGKPLCTGDDPFAVMEAHLAAHAYPAQWPAGVPAGLNAVLDRVLAQDPTLRHHSAGELVADLRYLVEAAARPAAQTSSADAPLQGLPAPGAIEMSQAEIEALLAGLGGAATGEAAGATPGNETTALSQADIEALLTQGATAGQAPAAEPAAMSQAEIEALLGQGPATTPAGESAALSQAEIEALLGQTPASPTAGAPDAEPAAMSQADIEALLASQSQPPASATQPGAPSLDPTAISQAEIEALLAGLTQSPAPATPSAPLDPTAISQAEIEALLAGQAQSPALDTAPVQPLDPTAISQAEIEALLAAQAEVPASDTPVPPAALDPTAISDDELVALMASQTQAPAVDAPAAPRALDATAISDDEILALLGGAELELGPVPYVPPDRPLRTPSAVESKPSAEQPDTHNSIEISEDELAALMAQPSESAGGPTSAPVARDPFEISEDELAALMAQEAGQAATPASSDASRLSDDEIAALLVRQAVPPSGAVPSGSSVEISDEELANLMAENGLTPDGDLPGMSSGASFPKLDRSAVPFEVSDEEAASLLAELNASAATEPAISDTADAIEISDEEYAAILSGKAPPRPTKAIPAAAIEAVTRNADQEVLAPELAAAAGEPETPSSGPGPQNQAASVASEPAPQAGVQSLVRDRLNALAAALDRLVPLTGRLEPIAAGLGKLGKERAWVLAAAIPVVALLFLGGVLALRGPGRDQPPAAGADAGTEQALAGKPLATAVKTITPRPTFTPRPTATPRWTATQIRRPTYTRAPTRTRAPTYTRILTSERPTAVDTPPATSTSLPSLTARLADAPARRPTPTPTAELAALLADHTFVSTDFATPSAEWDNYSSSSGSASYADGRYAIASSGAAFVGLWKGAGAHDTVALQADALGPFQEGGAALQGLVFGWQKDWSGTTYIFGIAPESQWCGFAESAGQAGLRFMIPKEPARPFTGGLGDHTLAVIVEDGTARGYVDGEFCNSYTVADYRPGYAGVIAVPWGSPGRSFFDNYRIYRWP